MRQNKFLKIRLTAGFILAVGFLVQTETYAQLKWVNVNAEFAPLPPGLLLFKTTDSLDGRPFIAYYVKARLKDKALEFTVDTTVGRRMTPWQFYKRNNQPVVVVNCTFFNFTKNQNLNVVIKDGRMVSYSTHSIPLKGKDSLLFKHPLGSAIGIDYNRNADVAWLITDSAKRFAYAYQEAFAAKYKDSLPDPSFRYLASRTLVFNENLSGAPTLNKWKMKTAVGGGPVLVQNGLLKISNEEELKFTGKAINDKHPRTCMGYTKDGYLVIMVIQGRTPGVAEGATLEQQAKLLIDVGCFEALNLDGGGSSCMLVNGKETIKPSDKEGERPIPAAFIIRNR